MNGTGLYDSLQIASNFMEQAEKLADALEFEAAFTALNKAKSYAFNNDTLLDDIQLRSKTLNNARRHYIKQLEEEAADMFNQEPFDRQKAREVLQTLHQYDGQNEIAQSLWEELQAKEAAERERRLVREIQKVLEEIWQQGHQLEQAGDGPATLAKYEQGTIEASKKAGDAPEVIPLQRLKLTAVEKHNLAKEKWEKTLQLVLESKGAELVEHFQTLKTRDAEEAPFFDENSKFVGNLPIDECLDRARDLVGHFAQQQVADYLFRARGLLAESPGAAYEIIQEGIEATSASETARNILEQELKENIQPALERREEAVALLDTALSKENPIESWVTLDQVEQTDQYTPGLVDARRQLATTIEQNLAHLLEKGRQFQDLEEFEIAQTRFREAIDISQTIAAYSETLQSLFAQVQKAQDQCLQLEQEVKTFEKQLAEIADLSQADPEQANEDLATLRTKEVSEQAQVKIERLQDQINFRLGVDRSYFSLEQKMLSATDPIDLISTEEGAKQACLDYPDEARFPRLVKRIVARRSYLKGSVLCQDPEQYVEAMDLLQEVVDLKGDDEAEAQQLLDKIATNEQQEADIAIAIEEVTHALDANDPRSAFLLLQPYRYAASPQATRVRELISMATTRWRLDIEAQLDALVTAQEFILPKVEFLIRELERAQSPHVGEWRVKALAPAYANAALDLQELGRWDEAVPLWEEAFRLAPKVPHIVEGRRNVYQHTALVRAQTTTDPAEKEQILKELNRSHSKDSTIKRHLVAFYYNQKRFAEARLALSQAKLLLEHTGSSTAEVDIEALHRMEMRVQEAEKIETQKSAILSQLKGKSTIDDLKEAQLAFNTLLESVPEQATRLQSWWDKLSEVIINDLKKRVAEIADKGGTTWERMGLLSKILVLRTDPQTQDQALRILNLGRDQLLSDLKLVVENPEGVGYGEATEALDKHLSAVKMVGKRIDKLKQLEDNLIELEIEVASHKFDLNDVLYKLDLTNEKLHFTQEKRRKINNHIVVALVTGIWDKANDSMQELELKGWGQHRGVLALAEEIDKAKRKRLNVETAIKQLEAAVAKEDFKLAQDRLAYILNEDPTDETQLQASLEVTDPYTKDKFKDCQEMQDVITQKLVIVEKLSDWEAQGQQSINWPIVRTKISRFADQGNFKSALEMALAAIGQNDGHSMFQQNNIWSLKHLKQHLETFPLESVELNSLYAHSVFDKVDQKSQVLTKQIDECTLLVEDLQQKETDFKQILNRLMPLLQRLKKRQARFSSIFVSSEIKEIRQQVLELVEHGREICPVYPGFADFDETIISGR